MNNIRLTAGGFEFLGHLEQALAPKTCQAFREHMPFNSQAIHVRWSGEAIWLPIHDIDFAIGFENNTSYPLPGQILLYPGSESVTEILLSYGSAVFASKAGQISGNHFITLTSGVEQLRELGKRVLWTGAQDVNIEFG
ncbi:MAG: DUF3830 family protein [Gammaproteobacteria bacterium]|nr:DUF3830 family protein [Gammaproteobacteria bacterium]